MLDGVTATRFDRRMTVGRTAPLLLSCERANGNHVEVVTKFANGPQFGPLSLMREAVCAMLAKDLGLPVPECFVVTITPEFIDSVAAIQPDTATSLRAGIPLGFGSAKLPAGYSLWMADRGIPKNMRASAVEIFAFDLLIQNADRRPENPNLQSRGTQFAIFDHELALMIEGILFWQPPWVPGALETAGAPDKHVLRRGLQGYAHDLTRLIGAWESVSDDRLAEYFAALPPEWTEPRASADAAFTFLRQLRDNVRPAQQEVLRLLK